MIYCRYYKKRDHRNINEYKEERSSLFNKNGWNILFFDETEVKDRIVLASLKEGGYYSS